MNSILANRWKLIVDLLSTGDHAFLAEIRQFSDAATLGEFAITWFEDSRATSRQLLLEYLDQPLNSPGHEALVKRLFKIAEAAEDDELMGRFLVLFDRSVRRRKGTRTVYEPKSGPKQITVIVQPTESEMPKGVDLTEADKQTAANWARYRLFSLATRGYLRRRAWRYFRKIGKVDPQRYFNAILRILPIYRDEDIPDGLGLIDNWGLTHILFHHAEALIANPSGWTLREGHKLAEIKPAPIYPAVWKSSPQPLLQLLASAQCRSIRVWAIEMLRQEHPSALSNFPAETLVGWLGHRSAEMVRFAVEVLRANRSLDRVPPGRVIEILINAPSEALDTLLSLARERLNPTDLTVAQAVSLACRKALPLASLGMELLRDMAIAADERDDLLRIVDTESDELRRPLAQLVCDRLSSVEPFEARWLITLLDSRFPEVREIGWTWLKSEPQAISHPEIWAQLLESPYDSIRLYAIEYLENEAKSGQLTTTQALNPLAIRSLWANVMLNVQRGARAKPGVVAQILTRVQAHPSEARELLPILGVALRSLRGPEFRAGLVGLTKLIRDIPSAVPLIRQMFPELKPASLLASTATS